MSEQKSVLIDEKTMRADALQDGQLDGVTGGDSAEFAQDSRIRHKYQCPKCNGTSFTRGIKTIKYWPIKKKVCEWLECTTCGAHYPIMGKNSLIMLD